MPGWLVALLVALVGLAAGLLGTYVRIAFERGAELRTRMLDAADEFVTAVTKAEDATSTAILHVIAFTHAWSPAAESGELRDEKGAVAEEAYDAAGAGWREALERVPRIRLLFGVDAEATAAAVRATDELGEAILKMAQIRAGEGADAIAGDLDEAGRVSEDLHSRTEAALEATNAFSRAARVAIAGESPLAKIAAAFRRSALSRVG